MNNLTILLFESKYPMDKIISIRNNLYIYDAKSHFLSEISPEEVELLCNFHEDTKLLLPEYLNILIERKVFNPGGVTKLTPSFEETKELILFELENQIPRKFTLEVTEECTLRCKYCFYTNKDENKRKHSSLKMREETALKAIDLYFSRYTSAIDRISKAKRSEVSKRLFPNLCWWGGEPFLNFDLIKKSKDYIESLDWSLYEVEKNNISFAVVTNFTILNEEIINFIVTNNIYVQISLDGNKTENDKNRVYSNGRGSFEQVFNNINILINLHPEYAKKYVSIQTVNADNTSEENIFNFFSETFNINTINSKISVWNPSLERKNNEFVSSKIPLDNERFDDSIKEFRILLSKLEQKNKEMLKKKMLENRTIYHQLQELYLLGEHIELDNPKGENTFSNKFSCPLGTDTLFVSANGNLHFCCKADQSFPIGNIQTGIEINKLEEIYNSYFEKINNQCKNCWAIIFCKICPALVCYDKSFVLPSNKECCVIRRMSEMTLTKYIILSVEFESLHSNIIKIFRESKNYRFDSRPMTIKQFEL